MDPLTFHDGCYCFRDGEVEEARQLGLEVRCGGGLPCSCMPFDDSSFSLVDPLFNSSAAEEWPSVQSNDPFKLDVWPSQDEHPEPQPQPQVQHQPYQPRQRPPKTATKRGPPESVCCGCPCKMLHQAAAQKKKLCCGDNCECSKGTCTCPDHIVSASGRCCEGEALHLLRSESASTAGAICATKSSSLPSMPTIKSQRLTRPVAPLPEPLSDISTPDNPVESVFREVLSSSVKLATVGSLLHPSPGAGNTVTGAPDVLDYAFQDATVPGNRERRTPAKFERARTSCCAPVAVPPPVLRPLHPPQSAPVLTITEKSIKTEATRVVDHEHVAAVTAFNCADCTLSFATQRELESHGAKKHQKNRPYVCNTCAASFLFKQNRDRHIVEVHQGKRPHPCPHSQCGAAFKNSSGLKQHTRTVHDKERPFRCEQCTSSFGQRNHLTQHVRVVHDRLKLFQCSICETSFSNRGNLNQHVRRKHGDSAQGSSSTRSKLSSGSPSG